MISITLGLGLILLSIYFNSLATGLFGVFCLAIGLYARKSEPVKEQVKEPVRKTRHTVIMSEPLEMKIEPWEMTGLPINMSTERPDFLPLPDYGFTDPLEKFFFGLPFKFLKKVD